MENTWPAFAFLAAFLLLSGVMFARLRQRLRGRDRLFETESVGTMADEPRSFEDMSGLRAWLYRAGRRHDAAVMNFLAVQILCLVSAAVVPLVLAGTGLSRTFAQGLNDIPGAIGEIFLPLVWTGPWILALGIAMLPTLAVRRARRSRVQSIEQDLPMFLEMLATLSEAGLGFDAALDRILRSQPEIRPLVQEFRLFQVEVLAGRPRVRCLRRLAERVDSTHLTIFLSALIQAEQVGGGVAAVLRRQAEDLRERRRERFLAQAMTLPVKLVFPLVICFLPGIFVVTLGPIFHQFFQFADGLMRNRGVLP